MSDSTAGRNLQVKLGVVLRPERQIKAEALREAADDLYSDSGPDHPRSTATWLRDRAAKLEGDEPQ